MSSQIHLICQNPKLRGYLGDIRFFETVVLKNVFIKLIPQKSLEHLQSN